MINQTVVPNFAPGTATSLDLPRSTIATATPARAEIRGVVIVNPLSTQVASSTGFCTVFTTLEIFDANGSTVAFTSDVRGTALSLASLLLGVLKL